MSLICNGTGSWAYGGGQMLHGSLPLAPGEPPEAIKHLHRILSSISRRIPAFFSKYAAVNMAACSPSPWYSQ